MGNFDWNTEVELQWNERAYFWNERSKMLWDEGSRKDIVPFIQKNLPKGSTIFDVGCGNGYGTYKLHEKGYDVLGVDISKEMISLAQNQSENGNIPFLHGNITDLPMIDESCHAIMSINALEWTEYPGKALIELGRILKKDGLLFVGVLGPTAGPRGNSFPRLYDEPIICNTMMPWEFYQLAVKYGFEYVDGYGVYRKHVEKKNYEGLPVDLKQALSFMWVFMLRKVD